MTTHFTYKIQPKRQLTRFEWLKIGAKAALVSVVSVLLVQAAALALWPEIALFRPLDSYLRTVVFVLVPAIGATVVFSRLVNTQKNPTAAFAKLSILVLVLSIIPDFAISVPHKTVLASSVTAFLHVVAAAAIVAMLVRGYRSEGNGERFSTRG